VRISSELGFVCNYFTGKDGVTIVPRGRVQRAHGGQVGTYVLAAVSIIYNFYSIFVFWPVMFQQRRKNSRYSVVNLSYFLLPRFNENNKIPSAPISATGRRPARPKGPYDATPVNSERNVARLSQRSSPEKCVREK